MSQHLIIDNEEVSFGQLKALLGSNQQLSLSADSIDLIRICREYLDKKLAHSDELIYGVNTGFGYLQNVKIDKDQIEQLQYNLIKSHACGIGDEVPADIIKLMLMLKIKSLSYGNSGVQVETVTRLVDLYNAGILPVIYTQGSLGASGDLAPLSHLSLPLIGLGKVYFNGDIKQSHDVLKHLNWQPIKLRSKEGLALINGTQFMSAYGMYCLTKSEQLLKMANIISAISFDAFDCGSQPFHEKLHSIRSHKGQVDCAAEIRLLLNGSEIARRDKTEVQDPYSFRCIPQVHGATKDTFDYVLSIFLKEINSVTDNPIVFPDDDLVLSGGNFHGQPLALALDFFSIAMSELANISERRIYQLISGQRDLPLFLVKNPGLHSGFMIPQYTAASIVSENKQLCTPASVDSISSSNNQEDHVSMGANAATKCLRVVKNVQKVLAIELMTAAQAMDFRKPLKTSPILEKLLNDFRVQVPFCYEDRIFHDDMLEAVGFVETYKVG